MPRTGTYAFATGFRKLGGVAMDLTHSMTCKHDTGAPSNPIAWHVTHRNTIRLFRSHIQYLGH